MREHTLSEPSDAVPLREHTLSHLSDAALLRELATLVAQDRLTTAAVLAHIAEVDVRKLFVPEGYSSMHEFCVGALRLSEDAAFKRIQAARIARRFPAIFEGLADGRFHLAGICLLAPHLTPDNSEDLLRAAECRRKSEIEQMLVRRFSRARVLPVLQACQTVSGSSDVCATSLAPGQVDVSCERDANLTSIDDGEVAVAESSAVRRMLRLNVYDSTYEKLRYAQSLLSHAVPDGDISEVLDRALDALIAQLERRKLGGGSRPRVPRERGTNKSDVSGGLAASRSVAESVAATGSSGSQAPVPRDRYIPAHVRRAVWERDQGRCTFVSASGHRCDARRFLEFDHIEPVARGGEATVEGTRLRCRAHNQYEAERAFGREFMEEKRRESAMNREHGMLAKATQEATQDVITALRGLGCRVQEARRAAEFTETLGDVTLDERLRAALTFVGRRVNTSPISGGSA